MYRTRHTVRFVVLRRRDVGAHGGGQGYLAAQPEWWPTSALLLAMAPCNTNTNTIRAIQSICALLVGVGITGEMID